MHSSEAITGRGDPSGLFLRGRHAAAWVGWGLGAAIALGIGLRFATLGMQSYHSDEAWTAGVVLHRSLFTTMKTVSQTESTPPLYYLLAWAWSKLFGTGEWGLRSLSAIFGVATIPVVYLIGRRMAGDAAGVAAAALAAVNPALIWYSQEARSYALLILISALGFLFFLRARDGFGRRDLACWAVLSALAIASHYFGAIPVLVESALLLYPRPHRRAVAIAISGVALAALALLPLAIHQGEAGHTDWIARLPLGARLKESATTFMSGETGRVILQPLHSRYAWIPLLLVAIAIGLAVRRGSVIERRSAGIAVLLAAAVVALALVAAAVGQDFVLARNLLPALVPLLVAAAVGIASRGAGRRGLAVGAALVVYWAAFAVYVDVRPRLQRPEWREIAADLGPPSGPREIVLSGQALKPLQYYLPRRPVELQHPYPPIPVSEVDVVSVGKPPKRSDTGLPLGFAPAGQVSTQTVTLTRYRAPLPQPVSWHQLIDRYTGLSSRDVLGQDLVAVTTEPPDPGGSTGERSSSQAGISSIK